MEKKENGFIFAKKHGVSRLQKSGELLKKGGDPYLGKGRLPHQEENGLLSSQKGRGGTWKGKNTDLGRKERKRW